MPDESTFNRRVNAYSLDYKETHLKILCDIELREKVLEKLIQVYGKIEAHTRKNPLFKTSIEPVKVEDAPKEVFQMTEAALKAGTGPMAAVAGTIAESVGRFLLEKGARWVVVENGGDVFLKLEEEKTVGIHAGNSRWSNNLAFKVKPTETPLGVCTSSATVGHSVNLGEADAVTVVAKSTALADAAATAIGNRVKGEWGMEHALAFGRGIHGLMGFVLIREDKLVVWGRLPELVKTGFNVER